MRNVQLLCILWIIVSLSGFNSSCYKPPPFESLSEYEQFQLAKTHLEKKRYTYASQWFERFILVHPASMVRDSSLYLLGNAHFKLSQYFLASSEYDRLVRDLPNSPLADDAMYMSGTCYYEMSPNYERDQEYTHKAVQKFQRLVEDYPDSPYLKEVNEKIDLMRAKLTRKEYETGRLYQKMGDYDAAIISFNRILKIFYDTDYAPLALQRKGECLMKKKEYEEAKDTFEEFLDRHPKHAQAMHVKDKLKQVNERLPDSEKTETSSR